MTREEVLNRIPLGDDYQVDLYVKEEFVRTLNRSQMEAYRKQILDYIIKTGDVSITKDYYFEDDTEIFN